jgi:hypothetical protein
MSNCEIGEIGEVGMDGESSQALLYFLLEISLAQPLSA